MLGKNNQDAVVELAHKLGLEPANAILIAHQSASRIIHTLILRSYIEYVQESYQEIKLPEDVLNILKDRLSGKLITNPYLGFTYGILPYLIDRKIYVDFVEHKGLSTDSSLEDVLAMSQKTIVKIKQLTNKGKL